MKSEPKVGVVLVNWNRFKDSIECIESILNSSYSNFEIIVVDNNSSDASIDSITSWAESHSSDFSNQNSVSKKVIKLHVHIANDYSNSYDPISKCYPNDINLYIIKSPKNGGFGYGNNIALKLIDLKSNIDYIWLINNDTVVLNDSMTLMVESASQHLGIIGSTLFFYDNKSKVQAYGGGYYSRLTGITRTESKKKPTHLDFINGASLMMSRDVFKKIGYFDESIFLYYEEFDYCFRAAKLGYGCFLSDAVVYHKHGASSNHLDDSFAWGHVLKNKPYVLKKNFGYGLWTIIHFFTIFFSAVGLTASKGKKKASRIYLTNCFFKFFL
jgi:GT2 family glycosyltransferase